MNIAFEKTRAREAAKQRRAACVSKAYAVELINHWPHTALTGAAIAGFWPIKDEIDVRPLMAALKDAGHTVCLPEIVRKAHPLRFRAYAPGHDLRRGPYGTAEPVKTAPEVTPQIVLLPLLAFTPEGWRLGYGGGFYDRTLAALREKGDVFACGVAYSGQETSSVPTDQYDQKLDGMLTETGFRKF